MPRFPLTGAWFLSFFLGSMAFAIGGLLAGSLLNFPVSDLCQFGLDLGSEISAWNRPSATDGTLHPPEHCFSGRRQSDLRPSQ
jgi:hypothetical protein